MWLLATAASILALSIGAPVLAARGPDTETSEEPRTLELMGASFTVPAGWAVDLESAAGGSPELSRDGVSVGVSEAVWLGTSDALVERVAELAFEGAAVLPDVPDDAKGEPREQWEIVSGDDAAGGKKLVIVVRSAQSVVLVRVSGPAGAVEAAQDQIDAITGSILIDGPQIDVEAAA